MSGGPDRAGATTSVGSLTLRGAIFLGVGAMVGAGIFALLGQAASVAGSAVWLSFLLAGSLSMALGYAMVKFGVRYPSSGGLVVYLLHGYRSRRVVGVAAWLGYLTAIVVVGAMVAVSFGDYAAALFLGDAPGGPATKVFAAVLVVAATMLAMAGPRVLSRVQSLVLLLLLAVFAVFVVTTVGHLDLSLLSPSGYPGWSKIVASVALTFFAFLGFAVISFAGGDLADPEREMPRAMYGALAITGGLYMLIAFCVFGTLTVAQVVEYGPTAIAEASRVNLGDAGYRLMSVAALLATASPVIATLYASSGLTGSLVEADLFPPLFGPRGQLGRHGGLLLTGAFTVLFVTGLDLGALASVGSAVSLSVFVLVALGAFRMRGELHARAAPLLVAILGSATVLVGFAVDLWQDDRRSLWVALGLVALALAVNELWTRRPHAAGRAVPAP